MKTNNAPHQSPPLSLRQKKVAAKVLYNFGWASRQVGEWIGISKDTVIRSKNKPTPQQLRQFETDFESAAKSIRLELRGLVYQRLCFLIPKEKRLDLLIKVAEFLEGKPSVQQNHYLNMYDISNLNSDILRSRRERGLS